MCIIDDEDNGEEIIDEKANPEAVILELEDKADRNRALEMLRRENPVSYEILLRTQVYYEPWLLNILHQNNPVCPLLSEST